jgi:hypothetical protein
MQPAGQDPEARQVPGTVTLPLRSQTNASPFWIMLLRVSGRLDHGRTPHWLTRSPGPIRFCENLRIRHGQGRFGVETLALFIRFWLTTTPPPPEPAAKAARAQAGARYDNFVATLGRRLSHGPNLRQEIPEDVTRASD